MVFCPKLCYYIFEICYNVCGKLQTTKRFCLNIASAERKNKKKFFSVPRAKPAYFFTLARFKYWFENSSHLLVKKNSLVKLNIKSKTRCSIKKNNLIGLKVIYWKILHVFRFEKEKKYLVSNLNFVRKTTSFVQKKESNFTG